MANKLSLTIVSQEKQLVKTEVEQITAPAAEGEVTILPNHIPLLSRLDYGELSYLENGQPQSIVISKGFINVEPENQVTIIVDAAKHVRDISLQKAEDAMKQAKETMANTTDQRELMMAEASLKQAMWEIRIAQKTKSRNI